MSVMSCVPSCAPLTIGVFVDFLKSVPSIVSFAFRGNPVSKNLAKARLELMVRVCVLLKCACSPEKPRAFVTRSVGPLASTTDCAVHAECD